MRKRKTNIRPVWHLSFIKKKSKPNLQNIPIKRTPEVDELIRRMINRGSNLYGPTFSYDVETDIRKEGK